MIHWGHAPTRRLPLKLSARTQIRPSASRLLQAGSTTDTDGWVSRFRSNQKRGIAPSAPSDRLGEFGD